MCFQLTVIGLAQEPLVVSGDEIMTVGIKKKWLDKRLFVNLSQEEGCACSLLSDDADWKEPIWKLRGNALPRLAGTLRSLHGMFEAGFEFEAMWINDQIKQRFKVSIDELLTLVNENRIANFTRYIVL